MAHLAKFTGGIESKKMYDHWTRATDDNGNYATYPHEHGGGGHIDRDKSKNNYTIGEIKDLEWVSKRLEKVYQKPNQKRPIQTCDIIVTLPTSESKDEQNVKRFFRAVYDSLKKQYGRNNNIIGAWVHLDESQPHIHFAFLPISERQSRQKPEYTEKLSTRAYWGQKNSLQIMHSTLQKEIDEAMGRHIEGIYDGHTKEQGGNKTIGELKAESAALQDHIDKYHGDQAEMIELRGEHVSPIIGDDYYKLTPHQYKRLWTLANVGIEQNAEYQRLRNENLKLTNAQSLVIERQKEYCKRANQKETDKRTVAQAEASIERTKRLEQYADQYYAQDGLTVLQSFERDERRRKAKEKQKLEHSRNQSHQSQR